jgi:trigger factor
MLPEFETALSGMSAGETRTFGLTFPADYHGKEVAGKAAEFTMSVQSVSEPNLPAVDSDFAVKFGIASGSVEELRAEIAANLTLELKRKIEGVLREQVLRALKSTSELIVPKSLVELEAQRMLERAVADLQSRGVKAEDMQLSADTFRSQAEERVAYGLIVNEITRVYQLSPKPEQVLALVREAAQAYEQPDAVVRWHYEKPGRLNDFEAQAVEQNVVDWALQRARVENRPTSFATLMEPPAR